MPGAKMLLPEPVKARIRRSSLYNKLAARRLASTSKRIDACAAQFAMMLHLSDHPPLAGKTCLEIGCGWVLSHAVVCHLLGARRIIASDISSHARPQCLDPAVQKSIRSLPRDILSPFAEHSEIRARFDNLLSIRRFDFKVLEDLGIEYVSPIDFAKERLNVPVDFAYSLSVLEHVPCDDVLGLLNNVAADLKPGGTMIHCIHLEDHKSAGHHPFGFLAIPSGEYPPALQSIRGNRIRRSRWHELFSAVENTQSRFVYEWVRRDEQLPARVDPSVRNTGEADLRVSHLGVFTKKQA